MTITVEQLRRILPNSGNNAGVYVDEINAAMHEFDIDTPAREAMFLAQVGHESASLTAVSENLNYSAEALMRVFPKYFHDAADAAQYARKPERIANRVYANRMGNRDESSGDGWRHRGAGLIQTTGANNQRAVAQHFGIAFDDVGDWLRTPEGAARSAGLFWQQNGLNDPADEGDIREATRRINGGFHGLAERTAIYERAKTVLGA